MPHVSYPQLAIRLRAGEQILGRDVRGGVCLRDCWLASLPTAAENRRRPEQQQDIPRVLEIAKKSGLEILPPSGA